MRRLSYSVVVVLVLAVLANQYRLRIRHQMADFDVYRTAAIRVVSGEPLYREADGHYQFKYLPAFAMAMVPFGLASAAWGKAIWFGLSLLWLGCLIGISVGALPDRHLPPGVLTVVGLLLMAKFFGHELTLGQANALLGAMLISVLVLLNRGSTTAAAVLTGLAVFVKPYAGLVWPWLALTRGPRAGAVTGLVIVAGLLLPVTIYGWHGNVNLLGAWWQTVFVSTEPNLLGADNISITAMWAKRVGVGPAATVLALVTSVLVVFLIALILVRRRQVARPDYVDLATLMFAIPLLSPQGWDYVLLLGTPAAVCVVDRWVGLGAVWRALAVVALSAMSLTTFDLMGRAAYGRFMNWSGVTLAALALLCVVARIRWRRVG